MKREGKEVNGALEEGKRGREDATHVDATSLQTRQFLTNEEAEAGSSNRSMYFG